MLQHPPIRARELARVHVKDSDSRVIVGDMIPKGAHKFGVCRAHKVGDCRAHKVGDMTHKVGDMTHKVGDCRGRDHDL